MSSISGFRERDISASTTTSTLASAPRDRKKAKRKAEVISSTSTSSTSCERKTKIAKTQDTAARTIGKDDPQDVKSPTRTWRITTPAVPSDVANQMTRVLQDIRAQFPMLQVTDTTTPAMLLKEAITHLLRNPALINRELLNLLEGYCNRDLSHLLHPTVDPLNADNIVLLHRLFASAPQSILSNDLIPTLAHNLHNKLIRGGDILGFAHGVFQQCSRAQIVEIIYLTQHMYLGDRSIIAMIPCIGEKFHRNRWEDLNTCSFDDLAQFAELARGWYLTPYEVEINDELHQDSAWNGLRNQITKIFWERLHSMSKLRALAIACRLYEFIERHLSPTRASRLIEVLKQNDILPDLSDVSVRELHFITNLWHEYSVDNRQNLYRIVETSILRNGGRWIQLEAKNSFVNGNYLANIIKIIISDATDKPFLEICCAALRGYIENDTSTLQRRSREEQDFTLLSLPEYGRNMWDALEQMKQKLKRFSLQEEI